MIYVYNTKPPSALESFSVSRTLDTSGWDECVLEPCSASPPDCCPTYSIPFMTSDVFCFEYNRTMTDVEVYNLDGTLVNSYPAWASGKTVCVKFSDLSTDLRCFYIVVIFATGDPCCADFSFERVPEDTEDCPSNTLLIESFYPSLDCHGHVYPAYSNRIRWWCKLEQVSSTSTPNIRQDPDGTDITAKETLRRVYAFRVMKEIQPESWILRHLTEVVLRGFDLTIGGIVFEKFNGEIAKNFEKQPWNIQIEITEKLCRLDYNCN